jgi:hypothetical protein
MFPLGLYSRIEADTNAFPLYLRSRTRNELMLQAFPFRLAIFTINNSTELVLRWLFEQWQ